LAKRGRQRCLAWLSVVAICGAGVLFGPSNLSFASAATNWLVSLRSGSKGESHAQPAITTVTGNPATFTAACVNATTEEADLTWTSAGSAVTGYEVYVSATKGGTYALDDTQPTGTALTVTETYTSAGKKYYRLEAQSVYWAFPGATITNAREASVAGTNGGYLKMATTGTECKATA
jgi:hypothetical protein